jgi:hypothetical protein
MLLLSEFITCKNFIFNKHLCFSFEQMKPTLGGVSAIAQAKGTRAYVPLIEPQHRVYYSVSLSNGIYSYTLIADGKVFETKKMVKQ